MFPPDLPAAERTVHRDILKARKEDVFRLHITMDNACAVDRVQRTCNLANDLLGALQRNLFVILDVGMQIDAS